MHRLRLVSSSLIAVLAFAGCRTGAQRAATTQPSADEEAIDLRRKAKWDESPTGLTQQPVIVAQGPTPLVHIFDLGGPIRVVDLTSNSPLVSVDVPGRTLVRIDDRNGVTVGADNLVPGPLPAGHRYGIYADPTTPNVYRRGVGPPAAAPAPAEILTR